MLDECQCTGAAARSRCNAGCGSVIHNRTSVRSMSASIGSLTGTPMTRPFRKGSLLAGEMSARGAVIGRHVDRLDRDQSFSGPVHDREASLLGASGHVFG